MMPQGPGLLLTFLYYFSTATLIADIIFAWQLGLGFSDRMTLQLGLVVGLATGLLGVYMNRSRTLALKIKNKQQFTAHLEACLAAMGFEQKTHEETFDIYAPNGWLNWFGGKMLVKLDRQTATIVGRASNIRQLEKLVDRNLYTVSST